MNDLNVYRERREVLDNILDRLQGLEHAHREISKSLRIMAWTLGVILFFVIYISYRLF